MIVELPDTTTSQVSKTLVKIREEGGAVALGRVLTLVIATSPGSEEEAIEAANDASREHPMRVIVVSSDPDELPDAEARLDAEIRVGGDAGASEVIVLRACGDAARDEESLVMGLLLPDAPVVAWWPNDAPSVPGEAALGRIAHRRITDASTQPDPQAIARTRSASSYTPGDADFAWTRLTLWRAQLAAVLDQPPYEPITGVAGARAPSTRRRPRSSRRGCGCSSTCRSTDVPRRRDAGSHGIQAVRLERESGDDRARARHPRHRDAAPARPARARPRTPPSQPPRLPRRRAPPPRPR